MSLEYLVNCFKMDIEFEFTKKKKNSIKRKVLVHIILKLLG